MSAETSAWLNTMTLIGFTEKRNHAWHYRAEHQGAETNHYAGAIPADDVIRRLFNFEVVERPLFVANAVGNVRPVSTGHKAMVASDNGDVLGIFKGGYQGHSYREWLLDGPGQLVDTSSGDLGIGSAGLLKNRAVAWVSIEVPETVTTPEGVAFRPNLLACTSFDGSLATTYKRVITNVVCDNTLSAGLSEGGQVFKVKHTRNSALRLTDARDALGIVHTLADDFAREVARLTSWQVSTREFDLLLDALVPVQDAPATTAGAKRSLTMATTKQDTLRRLYAVDPRCAPWKHTAWGVLQAWNTYEHHEGNVKGNRAQRNALRALDGSMATSDELVLSTLAGLASGGRHSG